MLLDSGGLAATFGRHERDARRSTTKEGGRMTATGSASSPLTSRD